MEKFTRLMKSDDTSSKPTKIFDSEVNENIGHALTLMDEFHGMMEMIRDDSNKITEEHLQEFRATALKMKTLYKDIDNLEVEVFDDHAIGQIFYEYNQLQKVVKAIEDNYNLVNKSLQEAESETNTFSLLKNTIRQVVSSGSQAASTSPSPRSTVLPNVYHTSDLISSKEKTT